MKTTILKVQEIREMLENGMYLNTIEKELDVKCNVYCYELSASTQAGGRFFIDKLFIIDKDNTENGECFIGYLYGNTAGCKGARGHYYDNRKEKDKPKFRQVQASLNNIKYNHSGICFLY